ncbi:uncharacterized protein LOC141652274 [Silene latifolia]|uniref:uncharacterized protein LOC141652274 n=1 Tax=Silene latifolia TaxID=37657 RepID=UPI003D77D049
MMFVIRDNKAPVSELDSHSPQPCLPKLVSEEKRSTLHHPKAVSLMWKFPTLRELSAKYRKSCLSVPRNYVAERSQRSWDQIYTTSTFDVRHCRHIVSQLTLDIRNGVREDVR